MTELTKDNILSTRRALGRSQTAFANLLGTTQVTVSRWERGLTHPQPVFRQKLVKLLEYAEKLEEGGAK